VVEIGVVASKRLGGLVRERGTAGTAAVALDFALAVCSKLVHGIVQAFAAVMAVFSLR
jgi:hypothetical protein